jgi:Domain of unknown function (DUF4114)
MSLQFLRLFSAAAVLGSLATTASAQSLSPIQITTKPLGLPLIGPVYKGASDSLSSAYAANQKTYSNYITSNLKEGVAFTGIGLNQLDPQRLYFLFDYAPRVYFIYGYAGYIDGLGATIATISSPSSSILQGNTFTVFPNAHWNGSTSRSTTYPVLPGDFVQLPTVKAGQQLGFFLYSNENSKGTPGNVFYNGQSNNPDNFQHMIAFFPDNSQYIIIGFEDMYGGGDQDCNDLMFVVDIGPQNALVLRNPNSLPK